LGQKFAQSTRFSLLVGMDPGTAVKTRVICACFSVEEDAICRAIRRNKLTTPAQIGAMLQAGTNCGSCIPELKRLLADIELRTVA
ncbi:MAG: (2Fe-2S)-binding protein, partial [Alphaproteobacteria bacterium]|nr:(2Fe-2S)-binding protein [Alphaproteobacteria bacterium]